VGSYVRRVFRLSTEAVTAMRCRRRLFGYQRVPSKSAVVSGTARRSGPSSHVT
jgi:hypothetical protein